MATVASDTPPAPPLRREPGPRTVGWRTADVLRAAAVVMGFYLLLRLLWFASDLFLVVFLGVLFGLAVSSGAERLRRWHVPRGLGAALIVLGCYALLIGLASWIAPTLREQSGELRSKIPEAADKIELWMNQRRTGLSTLLGGRAATAAGSGAPAAAAPTTTGSTAAAPPSTPTGATPPARDTTGAAAKGTTSGGGGAASAAPTAGQPAQGESAGLGLGNAMHYLFPFLHSTVEVVAGILLITFLSIYIGADPELYHAGMMHLFPHRIRDRARDVTSEVATQLRKWLVTQLIGMIVLGVVTTIVLAALHVRAALALGVLAGLFEFIPTLGPFLSAVPAIAMGFLDSPEKALYVTIAYVGIHFMESHLLVPLLMKGGINLPPALTIVSQALMAMLFGFLGLMMAVPVLAAIMVPIRMVYVEGVVGDEVRLSRPKGDASEGSLVNAADK